MAVLSVYIINKAGGLIYQYDHNSSRPEIEKTFGYPLEVVLKVHDDKVVVAFGERDAIKGLFLILTHQEKKTFQTSALSICLPPEKSSLIEQSFSVFIIFLKFLCYILRNWIFPANIFQLESIFFLLLEPDCKKNTVIKTPSKL